MSKSRKLAREYFLSDLERDAIDDVVTSFRLAAAQAGEHGRSYRQAWYENHAQYWLRKLECAGAERLPVPADPPLF